MIRSLWIGSTRERLKIIGIESVGYTRQAATEQRRQPSTPKAYNMNIKPPPA